MRRKTILQIIVVIWIISTVAFFLGVLDKFTEESIDESADSNIVQGRQQFHRNQHSVKDKSLVDHLKELRNQFDVTYLQPNFANEDMHVPNNQGNRNGDENLLENNPLLIHHGVYNEQFVHRQDSLSYINHTLNKYWKTRSDISLGQLVPGSEVEHYTQGSRYTHSKAQNRIQEVEKNKDDIGIAPSSRPESEGASSTFIEAYRKYLTSNSTGVWPSVREKDDRILNQLFYQHNVKPGSKLKRIYSGGDAQLPKGQQIFLDHGCPISECYLTSRQQHASTADAILFHGGQVSRMPFQRPPKQIWMWFLLESPYHSYADRSLNNVINWTLTYRTDSVIVTPYERFTYFNNYTGVLPERPLKNYASGKTKKVAWFVSNCWAPNGRLKYVEELRKYIDVDIYGSCGTLQCDRFRGKDCDDMLRRDYKFYLSFENSNCKDYITEKFYWNALKNDVLPIVMGARPSDYARVAPPRSFIHVDRFKTPRELADYLHLLDRSDDLYNSYFRWKETGEYIDTKFWCRVCALLHAAGGEGRHMSYPRLDEWWKGRGICVDPIGSNGWATWRNVREKFDYSRTFPHTWTESANSQS